MDMEDTALADANDLAPTIRAYRELGLRGISQGNLNASFGSVPGLSPRVVRLLTPYTWLGPQGALA